MAAHDTAEASVRELTESHFKDYANKVLQAKSWADYDASKQADREKRRRDFVDFLGIDLKKFDAGLEKDDGTEIISCRISHQERHSPLAPRR
jgi:hypothetical protein